MARLRKKKRPGDLISISIGDQFAFAGMAAGASFIFFDGFSRKNLRPKAIEELPIAFTIWVDNTVDCSPNWQIIGSTTRFENFQPPDYCRRSIISDKLEIYRDGRFFAATVEECLDLELAMIWNADAVEERLEFALRGLESPLLKRNKASILGFG